MKSIKEWLEKLLVGDKKSLLAAHDLEQTDMIAGIGKLYSTTIKEIMVPRVDVEFIPADFSSDGLVKKIVDLGYSRFPVYAGDIDTIIGILYTKDVVKLLLNKQDFLPKDLMRKAYFVPESMKIGVLLAEFKKRHVHIAIVVDEYGGVSGIASLEDIIEEIVGDIQDEFDDEDEELVRLGANSWLCDARLNISDLNEELNIRLPTDDYDTIGGLVFYYFGKIPVRYEKTSFNNIDFIIQKVEGHRIESIKIVINEDIDKELLET